MLNKIAFIYEVAENQNDKFTPKHTVFDCAIQYGTKAKPYKFTYQCNTDFMLPNIKDVMYALLSDMEVVDYEYDTAQEMGEELGYDLYEEWEKVEKIWKSCTETSEALHKMFNDDEIQALSDEVNDIS